MEKMETKVLPVLEMSCVMCAKNVESTVQVLEGVKEASVNFAANTLSVTFDSTIISLQKIQSAVQSAGYG